MNAIDRAGFADPVAESQGCFRAVLDAMARPGSIMSVGASLDPPPPLDPATAAVLLTLLDAETPLWLDAACMPAGAWLRFQCGAPQVAANACAFAVGLELPDLASLSAGTDVAPQDAATLVLQVGAIGQGTAYRLSGPGLAGPATLRVDGLGDDFVAWWHANHARFPRGIDLILCAGTTLAALPRSVAIMGG